MSISSPRAPSRLARSSPRRRHRAGALDSLLAIERTPRTPTSDDGEVGEPVADPAAEQAYEQVLVEVEVRDLAGRLDERERTILWSHYGLGSSARTLTQIGSDLGLTAERIRQIEAGALEKLREAAAEPPEPLEAEPRRAYSDR